jgi:hypothetical protein
VPDIASITSALSSIKAASDIVKLVRESGLTLEKAEVKLKLAELVEKLADAKLELVGTTEVKLRRHRRAPHHRVLKVQDRCGTQLRGFSEHRFALC